METNKNSKLEITAHQPATHGDLSAGVEVTLGRTPVYDPNPDNSLERIGPDNFRGFPHLPTLKSHKPSA